VSKKLLYGEANHKPFNSCSRVSKVLHSVFLYTKSDNGLQILRLGVELAITVVGTQNLTGRVANCEVNSYLSSFVAASNSFKNTRICPSEGFEAGLPLAAITFHGEMCHTVRSRQRCSRIGHGDTFRPQVCRSCLWCGERQRTTCNGGSYGPMHWYLIYWLAPHPNFLT